MHPFGTCSDDFYLNLTLNAEMELGQTRESALHYFEQLRKKYPRCGISTAAAGSSRFGGGLKPGDSIGGRPWSANGFVRVSSILNASKPQSHSTG